MDDEIYPDKINLDDLYDNKKKTDMQKLNTYNKILNRIHKKIKVVSRQRNNMQCCWYVVPEIILGVPKFDHTDCISYILDKLYANGFKIKYTHPNLLLISWNHWIPGYVRNEIKKKTGVNIDGNGNKIIKNEPKVKQETDYNSMVFNLSNSKSEDIELPPPKEKKEEYKKISSYKPSGFIYDTKMLQRINKKLE